MNLGSVLKSKKTAQNLISLLFIYTPYRGLNRDLEDQVRMYLCNFLRWAKSGLDDRVDLNQVDQLDNLLDSFFFLHSTATKIMLPSVRFVDFMK